MGNRLRLLTCAVVLALAVGTLLCGELPLAWLFE